MTRHTELLTEADRAEAIRIAGEIAQTADYQLARRFIASAHLAPARTMKTCSVDRVRAEMLAATGATVTLEAMVLALADAGFVARELDGEASTNVKLRSFPKRGERVDLAS